MCHDTLSPCPPCRPLQGLARDKAGVTATDASGCVERFDDVVLACDAETVLKVLKDATW
jgi:predicted NAD/FAD-binding protein